MDRPFACSTLMGSCYPDILGLIRQQNPFVLRMAPFVSEEVRHETE